jgi:hypothetical protein
MNRRLEGVLGIINDTLLWDNFRTCKPTWQLGLERRLQEATLITVFVNVSSFEDVCTCTI